MWLPKKTSRVKHKPVRNGGSGRPKKTVIAFLRLLLHRCHYKRIGLLGAVGVAELVSMLKPKFHYADFPEAFPSGEVSGKSLSVMEFGLNYAKTQDPCVLDGPGACNGN